MRGTKAFALMVVAGPLLAAAPPSFEQGSDPVPPPEAPAGWRIPHTAWGDPDLTGTSPLDLGRTPMQRDAVSDWPHHLGKMVDFWSSVMLTSGRYKGNPVMMHLKHKPRITPELFGRWLAL